MEALSIFPDTDVAQPTLLRGRDAAEIWHVKSGIQITGMKNGTRTGNPTVAIVIPLPDGTVALAETTLKLFLTAADTLRATHGDPR